MYDGFSCFINLTIHSNVFDDDLSIGSWLWSLATFVLAIIVFRNKFKGNNENRNKKIETNLKIKIEVKKVYQLKFC